jgi:signal peptidase II
MRYRSFLGIIFVILCLDQGLKFWVKTHMYQGQDIAVIGSWFRIHFVENEGMAYGIDLGNGGGKLLLSIFRLIAVAGGFYLVHAMIKRNYPRGLIICGALIIAGALGNLIDSLFYGMLFSSSDFMHQVATFLPATGGYASFLHGRVVDMLWFPIYHGFLPRWLPFAGGHYFNFFAYVFNVADASISAGVITIILFQKSFFRKNERSAVPSTSPESAGSALKSS